MNTKLTMRYPTSWHQDMWREGVPFGNGLIGGMVYGGIFRENILINHALLWRGGRNMELPDIRETLPKIRKLLDEKRIKEADTLIRDTLHAKGYGGDFVFRIRWQILCWKPHQKIYILSIAEKLIWKRRWLRFPGKKGKVFIKERHLYPGQIIRYLFAIAAKRERLIQKLPLCFMIRRPWDRP